MTEENVSPGVVTSWESWWPKMNQLILISQSPEQQITEVTRAFHGSASTRAWTSMHWYLRHFLVDVSPAIHQQKIPTDLPPSLLSPNVILFRWVPQPHFQNPNLSLPFAVLKLRNISCQQLKEGKSTPTPRPAACSLVRKTGSTSAAVTDVSPNVCHIQQHSHTF